VSGLWQVEITNHRRLAARPSELSFRPNEIGGPAQLSSYAAADLKPVCYGHGGPVGQELGLPWFFPSAPRFAEV
jgi:hypothetical protein